jgi:hypothetical protein
VAKFHGRVGFGQQAETAPGVWTEQITEHSYYGDVIQNSRSIREGDNLNPDITIGNSISIVADAYANEHIFAMRYVEWAGERWAISNIDVQRPRLILRLGEVYNGPTVATS